MNFAEVKTFTIPEGFARKIIKDGIVLWQTQNYIKKGLVLWCDGKNNTGNGHDNTVTTWVDLSGNGNDIINVSKKSAVVPADTVKGEWKENGIFITADNSENSEYLRTVNEFDLSGNRTLEIRFTIVEDKYAAFGFAKADRYKYRIFSNNTPVNDWVRLSESDTANVVDIRLNKSAEIGIQQTFCITKKYNAEQDSTVYTAYLNSIQCGTLTRAGDFRENETSHILLGNERDVAIFHSVRLYDRALTANEIVNNYKYDIIHFTPEIEYVKSGLKMLCDGVNNIGTQHSTTACTWLDLTGNGNDLISVSSKTDTSAASTVQGTWNGNGITIESAKNQFLRTVKSFDLGADRTMELCITPLSNHNMELGLVTGERLKIRENGANWFFLLSYSDTSNVQVFHSNQPTVVDKMITVSISREYDTTTNTTTYKIYSDGVLRATKSIDGNYRSGETSYFVFDDESMTGSVVAIHSVRFYDRVLNADEIKHNYEEDQEKFSF